MAKTHIQPTHITALDEILDGGIPQGAIIVLTGAPGSGKTILASNWLCAGQEYAHEPGLFIAATESVDKSIESLQAFKFFNKAMINPKKLHFTDLHSILKELDLSAKPLLNDAEIEEIIIVIRNMVDRMQAKRVVIDSITAILYKLDGPDAIRNFIFRFGKALSSLGATVLLISEAGNEPLARLEEFIADGIIAMSSHLGGNSRVRQLEVTKMRRTNYRSGPVIFDITEDGFMIYPKIPSYSLAAKTDFINRVSSGIPELDQLLQGGYPQGHMILFGGNTGSGKSTFGLQFLVDGITKGEPVVMVALEESVTQIKKNAATRDWDFDEWEKQGLLTFVTTDLIDIYPDKLMYDIVRHVERIGAKRVVIDSMSSMESGTFNKHHVREFYIKP